MAHHLVVGLRSTPTLALRVPGRRASHTPPTAPGTSPYVRREVPQKGTGGITGARDDCRRHPVVSHLGPLRHLSWVHLRSVGRSRLGFWERFLPPPGAPGAVRVGAHVWREV